MYMYIYVCSLRGITFICIVHVLSQSSEAGKNFLRTTSKLYKFQEN